MDLEIHIPAQVVPNEVANIQPVYPWEFHSGLWGGEGIVGGFKAPPKQKHQPGKSYISEFDHVVEM